MYVGCFGGGVSWPDGHFSSTRVCIINHASDIKALSEGDRLFFRRDRQTGTRLVGDYM